MNTNELSALYNDDVIVTMKHEQSFADFLELVEDKSKWATVPVKELQLDFEEEGLSIEVDGKRYPIGNTAYTTLYSRAGIKGPVLGQLLSQGLANVLNECFQVRRGDALIRVVGGKIRACHGGDATDYKILPIPNLFNATRQELAQYENTEFLNGYWDHSIMAAQWDIKDEDVIKKYIELYEDMYIPLLPSQVKTIVNMYTSDVGSSAATVTYSVEAEGTNLVIGNNIKLEHRRNATVADFKDNLMGVFAGYKEAFKNLANLKNVSISFPHDCILQMAKKADLPAKYAKPAAENFVMLLGEGETDALKVYSLGINGIIDIARRAGETEASILIYKEKIARCLQMNFKKFDSPID